MKEKIKDIIMKNKQLACYTALFVITVIAAILSAVCKKQLESDIVIPTMVCDRYFYPVGFERNENQKTEIPLSFVKAGTPLTDLKLNTDYPVYQNNGATLYLYEDNYCMVTEKYEELTGVAGVVAGQGKVFDEKTSMPIGEKLLFLKYPDVGAYVSLVPIRLEGEIEDEIPQFSLFWLSDDKVEIYEYYRGRLRRRNCYVTDRTLVFCGEEKYTFYEWKARMRQEEIKVQEPQKPEDVRFYFFDMGDRFTTEGELVFRRTSGNRIVLENGNNLFNVHQIPLYYEDKDVVLLPGTFGLVQPWVHKMNSLPEMTYLVRDTYVVGIRKDDWFVAMKNAFLYDGGEHYIMLDYVELVIGNESVTLAPLSLVTVEDEAKISVFEYDSKEFKTYYISGGSPVIRLGSDVELLPLQKKIERLIGTGDLLIADTELLPQLQ